MSKKLTVGLWIGLTLFGKVGFASEYKCLTKPNPTIPSNWPSDYIRIVTEADRVSALFFVTMTPQDNGSFEEHSESTYDFENRMFAGYQIKDWSVCLPSSSEVNVSGTPLKPELSRVYFSQYCSNDSNPNFSNPSILTVDVSVRYGASGKQGLMSITITPKRDPQNKVTRNIEFGACELSS